MSILSLTLKSLIDAPINHRISALALKKAQYIFRTTEKTASSKGLGPHVWLALFTATAVAVNSPEYMIALYQHATKTRTIRESVQIAEYTREVGLRCIAVIGVRSYLLCSSRPADSSRFRRQTTCSSHFAEPYQKTSLRRSI